MQHSPRLRALQYLKPRENEANHMGEVESGDLMNLDAVLERRHVVIAEF